MDCEVKFRDALVEAGEEGRGIRFHLVPVEWWDQDLGKYRPTLLWSPLTPGGSGGEREAQAVVLVPDFEPGEKPWKREWPGFKPKAVLVSNLRLMVPVEVRTGRLLMGILEAEMEELGGGTRLLPNERLQFYQAEIEPWGKAFDGGFGEGEVRELAMPEEVSVLEKVRKGSRAWLTVASMMDGLLEGGVQACEVEERGRSPWSTVALHEGGSSTLALVGPAPKSRKIRTQDVIFGTPLGPGQKAAMQMLGLAARAAAIGSVLRQCDVYDEFRETHPLATWSSQLGFHQTQLWMKANKLEMECIPPELWGFNERAGL